MKFLLLTAVCLLNIPSGLVIVSSGLDVSGTISSEFGSKLNTGSDISLAESGCRGSDSQSTPHPPPVSLVNGPIPGSLWRWTTHLSHILEMIEE